MVLAALGIVVVVVLAIRQLRIPNPLPTPAPLRAAPAFSRSAPPPAVAPALPVAAPAASVPVEEIRAASAALPDVDRQAADTLVVKLQRKLTLAPADLQAAEGLFARHPAEPGARDLLEGVVMAAAAQSRDRRDTGAATGDLRRAAGLLKSSSAIRGALLAVLLDAGDWSGAEAAARDLLGIAPDDADGVRGLAYALVRQDRSREAAEYLRAALDRRDDPTTRALLAQVETSLRTEKGMTEQRLAYFNVRYDGEAHEDVGREILRQLEHHRSTLIRTFDYEPATTIPVILFSQQGYYDATGAPAWAGGHYDNFDGRIRIPIGGLTAALTPDMDGTLLHELTHAFIAARSRGIAPREVHEGLAQLMEGKRLETMLNQEQRKALADGRIRGVMGFYLGALSFAEFLMAERGQGGVNDLLQTMGDTGSVDQAFRKVFSRGYEDVMKDWSVRLRRQYGS
jgi:tetratricopeptide (TPR) repeat protein